MEYPGTFDPPMMGGHHVPLAIAGQGRLIVSETVLRAEGFRGSSDHSLLIAVGVVLALIGLPVLLTSLGLRVRGEYLGAVIAGGVLAVTRQKRAVSTLPLVLDIPWSHVKSVAQMPNSNMIGVLVAGQKPQGMIHFVPQAEPSMVCSELQKFLEPK